MKNEGYKVGSTNHNLEYIFKPAITWTKISSSSSGFRSNPQGFLFDDASGLCPAREDKNHYMVLGLLNSPLTVYALKALNPTLNLNPGNLADVPFVEIESSGVQKDCEKLSLTDWDSYETSWDFIKFPLILPDYRQATLKATYAQLRSHWREITMEMQRLEEENNRIFIEAYGLQDELTTEVSLNEISLTCNPHYRYGMMSVKWGVKSGKQWRRGFLKIR